MSNRCPDCERFVSLEPSDEGEFTIDPEVDEVGNITAEFRLVVTCAECGGEMKEASVEIYIDPTEEIEAHLTEHTQIEIREAKGTARRDFLCARSIEEGTDLDEETEKALEECMDMAELDVETALAQILEVECTSVSISTRYSGDSKTRMRFRKKFYVVELEFHVTCSVCTDWEGCTVTATEEVQASHLEDLNW